MARGDKLIEIVSVDDDPRIAAPVKRSLRLVAFPWAYLVDVCRLTEGQAALALATHIYRRTHVCKSQTVTLPGAELRELGINRELKRTALARLEAVGLIRIEGNAPGRTAKVTLLWTPK